VTRQNRVLPTGEIAAVPLRGAWMGNRGILHDEAGQLGTARWRHQNWVTCALSFKGRKRQVMRPGRFYTELFFYDEAVALAAGHRPCAECRRAQYLAWRAAFEAGTGCSGPAAEMDRRLHRDRVRRDRSQVRHEARAQDLPDGSFILLDDQPAVLRGDAAYPFAAAGYAAARPRPRGMVTVLTPRATLATLSAGYRCQIAAG
jgi:hypothetical protein